MTRTLNRLDHKFEFSVVTGASTPWRDSGNASVTKPRLMSLRIKLIHDNSLNVNGFVLEDRLALGSGPPAVK